MSTTFSTKTKVDTFTRKVEINIPDGPKGHIEVDYRVKSKPEIQALGDSGLTDEEYLPEIVVAIRGLGNPETDEPLTGQAAIDEALNGHYSMYLTSAIVQDYFASYGDARKGNSKRRR